MTNFRHTERSEVSRKFKLANNQLVNSNKRFFATLRFAQNDRLCKFRSYRKTIRKFKIRKVIKAYKLKIHKNCLIFSKSLLKSSILLGFESKKFTPNVGI